MKSSLFNYELPFLDYAQVFTVSSLWFDQGRDKEIATFDVTVREMPGKRNFLMFSGIEEIVNNLLQWKYNKNEVDYLVRNNFISDKFGKYLKSYRFDGDLWSLKEGTVFFPGEPVVRVSVSLPIANLLTAFLVNSVCYPILFLSKAVRIRLAARGKQFFIAGAVRVSSFENIFKITRLAYLVGSGLTLPYVNKKLGIKLKKDDPVSVSLFHALIKSYKSEKLAFYDLVSKAGPRVVFNTMIDTYDLKKGLKNYIAVEREARKKGKSLGWVNIDSGDLAKESFYVRRELNKAGFHDTKIIVCSNLDEYKIDKIESVNAPVDIYASLTETINISDGPVLEAVYKLAELRDDRGKVEYVAKLTSGKSSLPGRKQVYRIFNKQGKLKRDIVGLERENLGKKLLVNYIKKGKLNTKLPKLEEIKEYINKQIDNLPKNLKSISKIYNYNVLLSKNLINILEEIREDHL